MKKNILVGVLVWVLIIVSFAILDYLFKNEEKLQILIVALLIIPFSILGAHIYYKDGRKEHGLKVGLINVTIAFALDILITIPFLIIPKGGSYLSFFTDPLLYLLVLSNLSTFYFYWKLKVKTSKSTPKSLLNHEKHKNHEK